MWQVAVAAAVAGSGILAKHLFTPQQQHQLQLEESESRTSQLQQQPPQIDDFDNGYPTPISANAISEELQQPDKDECSSFGWGLGLGMMYMMSAGKAEVSKLSNAIDETTKIVHELKTKLSSQCPQLENGYTDTNTMDPKQKPKKKQENLEPFTLNKQPIKAKDPIHFVDSEYATSVLTEEQQLEGVEMGQLESELGSELQKLPWCTVETSGHEGDIYNSLEYERCESMKPSSTVCQSGGISPAELKNKLSLLLIEQQESHILELESELNLAYSKLKEKDGELRALKDCVRRLTEFSLTSVSDEETEACREERQRLEKEDCEATIGMKRAMDFETCGYQE